ncbi:MAG: zinc-dependent peptidase [Thiovulaceae bacterium]|nr:zinc-dependent peptidase [Sulfurimonadaceae bacterium]
MLIFGGMGVTILALFFLYDMRKKRLLHKIELLPFPELYITILVKTPYYSRLSLADQTKLQRSILHFIHTKEFIGVYTEVTEEMKVIIAFYACLLLVHKEMGNCYESLKTIIVYPHAVVSRQIQSNGGIYTNGQFSFDGQSANDTVVITWHEAEQAAYHLRHNNVIIHEFAHEIDFMDGEIDGIPPIEKSKYHGWVHILGKEFDALNVIALKNRNWGKYKLLGEYAASNEAEFFAVLTERFFESPASLKHHFPELYNELESFYNIDTAKLFTSLENN